MYLSTQNSPKKAIFASQNAFITEYGQFEDYTYETYVLYEDGILADSDDKVFDDYEEVLGLEFIDHLKKYDIDAVYVRNDVLKKDFEIIPDSYRFEDIVDANE